MDHTTVGVVRWPSAGDTAGYRLRRPKLTPVSLILMAAGHRAELVHVKKSKGSPYSITERRVPELVPVLGSQPAGDVSHKPGGRLPFPPGLQLPPQPLTGLPPQPLRGLLPILLLGEQRHNRCEQFA